MRAVPVARLRARLNAAILGLATVCACVIACGSRGPAADGGGPCPPQWVARAAGGCGPAVWLCEADGGAAPGACGSRVLDRPQPVTESDGGVGATFARAADGRVVGGWIERGEPAGPPALTWRPEIAAPLANDTWTPFSPRPSCPTGWTRDAVGCAPTLVANCPLLSEALPDGTCTRTSSDDCPAGPYADESVISSGGRAVYVLAGSDRSLADGTRAHPYATLSDARGATSADNEWFFLGDGRYSESIEATGALHVVGRCSSRVQLAPTVGAAHVVARSNAVVDLRSVSLVGAVPGVAVEARGRASLARVRIDGVSGVGILADGEGATVDAEDVVVARTSVRDAMAPGRAIQCSRGASVTLRRSALVRNIEVGVWNLQRSMFAASDTVVRDTAASQGRYGNGIWADTGSRTTLTRVVLQGNREGGLTVIGTGTSVTTVDLVVRNTLTNAAGGRGRGVEANGGAQLTLSGARIEGSSDCGILALGTSTRISIDDTVVLATRVTPQSTERGGVVVVGGGHVEIRRSLIADSGNGGILVSGANSMATIARTEVRGVTRADEIIAPDGIQVSVGATVDLSDSVVDDVMGAGLRVVGPDAQLTVERSGVRHVHADHEGTGVGLIAFRGGHARIAHSRVSDVACTGIASADGQTEVSVEAVDVGGVAGAAASPCGSAIAAGIDSRMTVAASRVHHFARYGVYVVLAATANVSDVLVEDLAPPEDLPSGGGVVAGVGGRLNLERASIHGVYGAGLAAYGEAAITGRAISVDDVRIARTLDPNQDTPFRVAAGISVQQGSSVNLSSVTVEHIVGVGVLALDANGIVRCADCAVRDNVSTSHGYTGAGAFVGNGAHVEFIRSSFSRLREYGAWVLGAGSEAHLVDVLIDGVTPSGRGAGYGAVAVAGGRLQLERVGLRDVSALGVATLQVDIDPRRLATDSTVEAYDVFIHRLRSSSAGLVYPGGSTPRPVAYSVAAASRGRVAIDHFVLDGGGHGFANTGGTLALLNGWIHGMLDAAGAFRGSTLMPGTTVVGVEASGNASDGFVRDDALAEGAALMRPTSVCTVASDLCR